MSEENKQKDLEQMLNNATNSDLNNMQMRPSAKERQKKLIIKSVSIATVVIASSVTGLYYVSKPKNNNTEQTQRYAKETEDIKSNSSDKIPGSVPDWVKKGPYDPEKTLQNKQEIIDDIHYTSFGNITGSIVGGSKFNTNKDEAWEKDSDELLVNKNYAAVTGEDYEYWTNVYINRLLNPQFGKWTVLQSPNTRFADYAKEIFKDMFDDAYFNSQNPDMKWLPIMADFNGDEYGGQNFAYSTKFVGEYTSISGERKTTEDGFRTITTVNLDVTWKAYLAGDKEIVKTGKISFDIEPRKEDSRLSQNKLVITRTSITVDK